MNTTRRFAALTLITAAGLAAMGSTQAWSWNIGSERVNGSGELATEARDVGSFDAISVTGGFKVQVRQNSGHKVEVKTDKNLLPYLETKVVDGSKGRTLEIGPKRGYSLNASNTPMITVDMAQLRAVAIAGSGDVRVEAMKTGELDASIAGSGDIRFDELNAERLALKIAGSGDIVASGRTGNLNVSVSGSGDVKARGLVSEDARVRIAGSGDVVVQANKKLDISIAGSGGVSYLGSPEISMHTAGSGTVRKLNQ